MARNYKAGRQPRRFFLGTFKDRFANTYQLRKALISRGLLEPFDHRICPYCDKHFAVYMPIEEQNKKFCSQECGRKASVKMREELKAEQNAEKACGLANKTPAYRKWPWREQYAEELRSRAAMMLQEIRAGR